MDAKRKDLKTLAKEGRVNIDPALVDELLDEAVQKLLDEYAERVVREQQTAAVLTTMGTVAETFGVRGAAQLASDISNNPPILENVTSGKNAACSVIDLEIGLQGYDLTRRDRNRNGGGVAIYVRNNISYMERSALVPENVEALCIEVRKPNAKPILISTWNRPPNSNSEILDFFVQKKFFSKALIKKTKKL